MNAQAVTPQVSSGNFAVRSLSYAEGLRVGLVVVLDLHLAAREKRRIELHGELAPRHRAAGDLAAVLPGLARIAVIGREGIKLTVGPVYGLPAAGLAAASAALCPAGG